jgi:GntR family transcriptional regulator
LQRKKPEKEPEAEIPERIGKMYIEIKPDSPISIFEQIMDGIRMAVLSGRLKEDEKLPSWRDLAVELRVNPNTVAKAYQELERQKVLYVKRGEGTFVAAWEAKAREEERKRLLDDSLRQAILKGHQLKYTAEEIKQELNELLNQFSLSWQAEQA